MSMPCWGVGPVKPRRTNPPCETCCRYSAWRCERGRGLSPSGLDCKRPAQSQGGGPTSSRWRETGYGRWRRCLGSRRCSCCAGSCWWGPCEHQDWPRWRLWGWNPGSAGCRDDRIPPIWTRSHWCTQPPGQGQQDCSCWGGWHRHFCSVCWWTRLF